MSTILDISNTLLSMENLITKEIHDYFTNNTFNFSALNINDQIIDLLTNFYNTSTHTHLTIYVGYHLILYNSNFENVIITTLYNLYDIDNKTLTIDKYTQTLFDILTDDMTIINNLNTNHIPNQLYSNIFDAFKIISVRENIGDIYNTDLHNKFSTIQGISSKYKEYLYFLNITIGLDLSNLDLSGQTFYDYRIYNANLTNSNFTNTDISNCILNTCDFSGCLFTNTSIYASDIRASNFIYIDLSSCTINSVNATNIFEIFTQDRLPITHRYDVSLNMIIKNTENLDKKGLAAQKAIEAGISGEVINTINSLSNLSSGEVSQEIQNIVLEQLNLATSEENRLVRKINLLRLLLFKVLDDEKVIVFNRENLLMPDVFLKEKVAVLESNYKINLNTYLFDEGFYIPIEDDEYVIMGLLQTSVKILINRYATIDGVGRYTITQIGGPGSLTINNYMAQDYLMRQYFIDGEAAALNNLDLFFGGIGEAELPTTTHAFGDPYIYPLYGQPTKLPDQKNIYRMLQGKNIYINSKVDLLSEKKRNIMKQWFLKKTGYAPEVLGFISNGYFFTDHWIFCDNHYIHIDLNNSLINVKENSLKFFNISMDNLIHREKNKFISEDKYKSYHINFYSKYHGKIKIVLKFYLNPQIDNGINVSIEKNKRYCIGLLVNNVKPNLMKLSKLTKKKDPILNRRFKKRKNKMVVRELLAKNELYI